MISLYNALYDCVVIMIALQETKSDENPSILNYHMS